LYEAPANAFVARFIGTPPMNLLRLQATQDGAVIAGTDGPALLPAALSVGALGIRPEHIALAHQRGIRAEVECVEYLGGDSLLSCRVGTERVAVRAAGATGLSRGDPTWLSWVPGAQHYFDAAGARCELPGRQPAATMFA
jgi:sn-glycerol 3-phosphate transport system ATP-binding protein